MTPSKEALSAADAILELRYEAISTGNLATLIDTAYAEHRERVRRLVEAARSSRERMADDNDDRHFTDTLEVLTAALAPFLEQETVT